MPSTRFAVAAHVLAAMALHPGKPMTSEHLARSVSTNPAVIRRLLCQLARAGLTQSQLGVGGGAMLARPAGEITLRDIFTAVEEDPLVPMPRAEPNQECPVGCHIGAALGEGIAHAETAFFQALEATTVAQVATRIQTLEREGEQS